VAYAFLRAVPAFFAGIATIKQRTSQTKPCRHDCPHGTLESTRHEVSALLFEASDLLDMLLEMVHVVIDAVGKGPRVLLSGTTQVAKRVWWDMFDDSQDVAVQGRP
jgi:hypothetical protein